VAINFAKLFHHTPVDRKLPDSVSVLKQSASDLMNKLKEVKQSAEQLDPSKIGSTDKCLKKLQRECDRVVINTGKFNTKGYMKDYNVVALDGLKILQNIKNFSEDTAMTASDKQKISHLLGSFGDALQSATSTKDSRGIDLNGVKGNIAKFHNHKR